MLLELVKGGYRGAKKERGGREECKGWNLTIDFLVDVLRQEGTVRKLDLSHLCFSLNFYFLMFPSQFPSMFPLLTYSQSFFSLSADYPRHSRQRRSQILILLIQDKSKNHFMT